MATGFTKTKVLGASLLGALLVLTACGGEDGQDTAVPEGGALDVVKVGVVPVSAVAALYLGEEKGFFEDEGIEIEMVPGQGTSAAIAGVVSSALNVGVTAPSTVIQARTQGIDLVAIGNAGGIPATGGGGGEVVVAAGSDVQSVKDLEGKRIAVYGLKSNNELSVRADMEQQGADPAKAQFVDLEFPAMLAAIDRGDVDAAALAEPFLSGGLAAGAIRAISPYIENVAGKSAPITCWFTSSDQLKDNADVLERFMRALGESSAYADANENETRAIMTTYTKMTTEQVAAIPMQAYDIELTQEQFEKIADLMVRYEFIDNKPDLTGIVHG